MNNLNEDVVAQMLSEALLEAQRLEIAISVAIVDAGGHLIGFRRHVDTDIVSITLSQDKAYTSLINRMETADLAELCLPGGIYYGFQNNFGGRMVIFGGGLPIRDDSGRVVGAIGVSGGSCEQDVLCAKAALIKSNA